MKTFVLRVVDILVGLFYRRVEVSGIENVPVSGPVLFIANHFNGLVDPMLVLHALPRPVTFVAKSTLWRIPFLRSVLDLLGCIPITRKKDLVEGGTDAASDRNEESFEKLASVLRGGGAVLIFPEGRSHSDASLSKIHTGAARVLLLSRQSLPVVPLGLWFTKKEEFRSEVLIHVGAPLAPPPDPTVEAWTAAIRAGLESVTLNARDWEDHEIVAAVEALYGERMSGEGTTGDFFEGEETGGPLARSFRNRQLLLASRPVLEKIESGAVASVARRARALARLLRGIGLSPGALDDPPPPGRVLLSTIGAVAFLVLGFPVAVLGVTAWYVPYRLCGVIADRVPGARENRDQVALYKLIAGTALFPLAFLVDLLLALQAGGFKPMLAALIILPFSGLFALRYLEQADLRERQARELLALVFSRGGLETLRKRRDELVAECDRLADVYRHQNWR